jgi:hypothetical protein
MAVARFVPLSAAPYIRGAAAIVALWPLAYEMWKHPEPVRAASDSGNLMAQANCAEF